MKRFQRFGYFLLLAITIVPVALPAAALTIDSVELSAADECWLPLSTAMLVTAAVSLWLLDKGRTQKIAGLVGFPASLLSLVMISVYTWYTEAAEFITYVPRWISNEGGPITLTLVPIAACCAVVPLFWSADNRLFRALRRAILLGILAASALIIFAAWTDRLIDSGSVLWQRIVISGAIASVILYLLDQPPKTFPARSCKISIICPCCQLLQQIPEGRSNCAHCRLQFIVTVADPACPRCSYNLRGLHSDACPECGLPLAPTNSHNLSPAAQ